MSRSRLVRSFLLSLSREKWGNRPFAASHSRGTKPLYWRAKVALGQDKQRKLPFKIMYAFCCSPAWQFCTTWMASCKGPIRSRIGTFIHVSPSSRARSTIPDENELRSTGSPYNKFIRYGSEVDPFKSRYEEPQTWWWYFYFILTACQSISNYRRAGHPLVRVVTKFIFPQTIPHLGLKFGSPVSKLLQILIPDSLKIFLDPWIQSGSD